MGVMKYKEIPGRVYKGEFNVSGYYEGSGSLVSEDGDKYKGEFMNGMKHGQGELILADGSGIYAGEFF